MRLALDTNLLVYAEGVNGSDRQEAALALITRLPRTAVVIPAEARSANCSTSWFARPRDRGATRAR